MQNIPTGAGAEAGRDGNVQIENTQYVDMDIEAQIQAASAKCLTTSLDIYDVGTSIFLDSRVTRAKVIFHAAAPPAADITEENEANGDPPIWCFEGDSHQRVVLTERGEEVLLGIFEEANERLRAAVPKVTTSILSVMLEDNHELCDKALRALRRTYGEL